VINITDQVVSKGWETVPPFAKGLPSLGPQGCLIPEADEELIPLAAALARGLLELGQLLRLDLRTSRRAHPELRQAH
jgi:hypothetical protein